MKDTGLKEKGVCSERVLSASAPEDAPATYFVGASGSEMSLCKAARRRTCWPRTS